MRRENSIITLARCSGWLRASGFDRRTADHVAAPRVDRSRQIAWDAGVERRFSPPGKIGNRA
jgi:hypothetical protein